MHILYLQQLLVLPGSPGTQRSWEMAKHWKGAGHQVSVIASTALLDPERIELPPEDGYLSLEREGIHLHLLDIPYSHFMSFRQRLKAFYAFYRWAFTVGKKMQGVDVVVAYSAPLSTGFLGRKLARELACPFVFEVGDVWPDVPIGMGILQNRLLIQLLNWQTRRAYKAAAIICTFSEGMKEQIISHGISEFKVHVVHNGVNLAAFSPKKNRDLHTVKVIYVGSLGPANGLSQLLYAWKLIEKKWSAKVSCHIYGEGKEGAELQALAKELGLRSLFFYKNVAQQEIPALLETADIGLVSVAPYEVLEANGSTKAFEYMAAGIPLVLNYEGWLAEYLQKYNCGVAAPMGHIETFAQKINRLITDKELRLEMGENARKLAVDQFDRKKLAQYMLNLFEEVRSFV